ncbi:hypothetical protein ABEB36_001698 [Hypothenemus hampei]|uniref:Uncharacterized protein n=1 Tax=Hypothenemus hampei TaxID=57062 RepID=A0ABD1FFF3_HYPHA
MVLGAAMATIGYYADQLSVAEEIIGNHTVAVKNESRGFHLNNLSYAGPIVMGVGGFIVVAACVMTFEARDSAAKVVPARLKLNMTGPATCSMHLNALRSGQGSMRTSSGSQTGGNLTASTQVHGSLRRHHQPNTDRRSITQSFVQFSRNLALETKNFSSKNRNSPQQHRNGSLKVPQGSINRSPSAPDLILDKQAVTNVKEITSPLLMARTTEKSPITGRQSSRRTLATCALLNPSLLQRHALSVDETAASYGRSNESLQHGCGSQGSMALDLHLESVTLKIRDKRRNPLKRQRNIEDDELSSWRRNSAHSPHFCSSNRLSGVRSSQGSAQCLPTQGIASHKAGRRCSNASDCTHRSRKRRRQSNSCHHHTRGKLERAISSDSRLTGAIPKCYHSHEPSRNNSTEHEQTAEQGAPFSSENDISGTARKSHQVMVHFSSTTEDCI